MIIMMTILLFNSAIIVMMLFETMNTIDEDDVHRKKNALAPMQESNPRYMMILLLYVAIIATLFETMSGDR
jgi:hypothetical protein